MAKYEIHNAHINHQHIEKDTPMDKELLQRLTNIIEGNLVNMKGAVMVLPVPHSAINTKMHIYLDKAMYALLEVKRELGLTSQLKKTATTVDATVVSNE